MELEIREFVRQALGVTEQDFLGCMLIQTDGIILHDQSFPFLKFQNTDIENKIIAERAAKLWKLANMHTSEKSFGKVSIVRVTQRMIQLSRKKDEQQPKSYFKREDYDKNMRSMDESISAGKNNEIQPERNFDTNIDVLSYGVGKLCVVEYKIPLVLQNHIILEQQKAQQKSDLSENEESLEDNVQKMVISSNSGINIQVSENTTSEQHLNDNSESESPPLPSPIHNHETINSSNVTGTTVESNDLKLTSST